MGHHRFKGEHLETGGGGGGGGEEEEEVVVGVHGARGSCGTVYR